MTYTAALEALDRKCGRTITLADYHSLSGKSAAALTDDDLTIIENFGGAKQAATARARRTQALTPPAPPAPAPTQAAAPALPTITRDTSDPTRLQFKGFDHYTAMLFKDVLVPALDYHLDHLIAELGKAFTKQKARVDQLEARIAGLEKRPTVKFTGTYTQGKTYVPGDAAVHQGGLWICRAETTGQPNQDFHAWTLAVKSRSIA
jgi:hypothetical protein